MTIRELYEWAEKNGTMDVPMVIVLRRHFFERFLPVRSFHCGSCDEVVLDVIPDPEYDHESDA